MELEDGNVLASHVIAHENPFEFTKQLNEFLKGKKVHQIAITTTPVIVGVQQVGRGNAAQMKVITSAYITWLCTQEQLDSFLFQQKTLIKG